MMTLCNTIIIITASCSMLVPGPARYAVMTAGLAGFIMICIRPIGTPASTGRLLAMNIGWRQLAAFMAALHFVVIPGDSDNDGVDRILLLFFEVSYKFF